MQWRAARSLRRAQRLIGSDPDLAVKSLREEAARSPADPALQLWLGVALAGATLDAEAEAAFARALELSPRLFLARLERGVLSLDRREIPAALERLGAAKALSPANPLADAYLALAAWDAGGSATLPFEKAEFLPARFRARLLLRLEEAAAAGRAIPLPETGNPSAFDRWLARRDLAKAERLRVAGRLEEALVQLQMSSEDLGPHEGLVAAKLRAIAPAAVKELRTEIANASKAKGRERRSILFRLGSAELEDGDGRGARPTLERWRESFVEDGSPAREGPEAAAVTLALAEIVARGDGAAALALVREARASGAAGSEADRVEGIALAAGGRGREALAPFERYLSRTLDTVAERALELRRRAQ